MLVLTDHSNRSMQGIYFAIKVSENTCKLCSLSSLQDLPSRYGLLCYCTHMMLISRVRKQIVGATEIL